MSFLANVKLKDIHIWTDNPRTGSVDDEINELISLIRTQELKNNNKLVELAKSIIEANGIYEPLGILKHKDGFLVVKEGNRRTTCLKLLQNPNLIPDEFTKLKRSFIELSNTADSKMFNNIPARIFNLEENDLLEEWIVLRHNGLQGGKGLDKWETIEKENWKKYKGINTPILDFQNYLIEEGILTEDEVFSVHKTNWERILGKTGRSYLGIAYDSANCYEIVMDYEDFRSRIKKTISALSGKSVSIVYDNKAIEKFFKSLNLENSNHACEHEVEIEQGKKDVNENNKINTNRGESIENNTEKIIVAFPIADPSIDETNGKTELSSDSEENVQNGINKDNYDNNTHRRSTKPAPMLSNLICDLPSSQDTDGIIRISAELRALSRGKEYLKYPIATAMLMRSFLEQCLICYLKQRKKWEKFVRMKGHAPTLTEIIDKYKSDSDIFAQDEELERLFLTLYDSPGLKEHFNLMVHHPHLVTATPSILESIASGGYLALVQHIINRCKNISGQK